jgi:hypothetical protein
VVADELSSGLPRPEVGRAVEPAGAGAGGLPLAVQPVGRPWEDHVVLAAARVVQRGFAG